MDTGIDFGDVELICRNCKHVVRLERLGDPVELVTVKCGLLMSEGSLKWKMVWDTCDKFELK